MVESRVGCQTKKGGLGWVRWVRPVVKRKAWVEDHGKERGVLASFSLVPFRIN